MLCCALVQRRYGTVQEFLQVGTTDEAPGSDLAGWQLAGDHERIEEGPAASQDVSGVGGAVR